MPDRKIGPRETKRTSGRRASSNRSLLFELLADLDTGVALASSNGSLLYANRRFADLMGIGQRIHLRGFRLKDCISVRSWRDFDVALRQASQRTVHGDVTIAVSGQTRTVRLIFSPVGGLKDKLRITASEITELVETSKALHSSQESLQSLSARILQVEDEERRRIARDLHDNTGQEVAALALALHRASVHSKDAPTAARQAIDDSMVLASKVESQIRTLSYLLHPPLLDELGLRAAIDWFVTGFTERSGIKLTVQIPLSLPRFSLRQETALFRVVQAALANVLRHSQSPTATIRLSFGVHRVQLSVEDQGKGMDATQLEAARQGLAGGIGLGGMRERLRELGGTLEINSGSRGTQVIATLPIGERALPAPIAAQPPEAANTPLEAGEILKPVLANGTRKRILIVDDHEVTRQGIRTLLAAQPSLEVVGEASDGVEAIAQAESLKPDLVVLDLTMPRLGGLAAATKIREAGAGTKILIFTTHSVPSLMQSLRNAGCQGYVLKERAGADLVNGINEVLRGAPFYCSQLR